MSTDDPSGVSRNSAHVFYQQDGKPKKTTYTFYRGDDAHFHPSDETFKRDEILIDHVAKGLMPSAPFIEPTSSIVAFGSCFANHISGYLHKLGYNIATKNNLTAYVSRMGDGIVNSFAIRQQFEWAWENKQPEVELWHGYDAESFGYEESVRSATKTMFDSADVFILTFGLAEVWYDDLTSEVFWRAVPFHHFDSSRHKFRVSSTAENLRNIQIIHSLIRKHRPDAAIVLTLSPIALTATFRAESCLIANAASKAILRASLDEFHRSVRDTDPRVFYFPSYEIALTCFKHHLMEDRKHVHKHVLDFNMKVFERYFCQTSLSDADLLSSFRSAQQLDELISRDGHWAAPRIHRRSIAPE